MSKCDQKNEFTWNKLRETLRSTPTFSSGVILCVENICLQRLLLNKNLGHLYLALRSINNFTLNILFTCVFLEHFVFLVLMPFMTYAKLFEFPYC